MLKYTVGKEQRKQVEFLCNFSPLEKCDVSPKIGDMDMQRKVISRARLFRFPFASLSVPLPLLVWPPFSPLSFFSPSLPSLSILKY